MNLKSFLVGTGLMVIAATAIPAARADTLVMQNVHREQQMSLPHRGMSMTQVEHRFGAPLEKLPTRGGDSPKHPPIHRWRYSGYTVYFERNHVIHAVANEAIPGNGKSAS